MTTCPLLSLVLLLPLAMAAPKPAANPAPAVAAAANPETFVVAKLPGKLHIEMLDNIYSSNIYSIYSILVYHQKQTHF